MTDDELDRALSDGPAIVPSPGFVSSVMERTRRAAAEPPPIPFPWKRFAPIPVGGVLAVVVLVASLRAPSAPPPGVMAESENLVRSAATYGIAWILLTLMLTCCSVALASLIAHRTSIAR